MLEPRVQRSKVEQIRCEVFAEAIFQFSNRSVVPTDASLCTAQLSVHPFQVLQDGRVKQLRLRWAQRIINDVEALRWIGFDLESAAKPARQTRSETLD